MRLTLAKSALPLLLCLLLLTCDKAEAGKPVAVRWWGQGMVSIETYWNLRLAIDPHPSDLQEEALEVAADVVLFTHDALTSDNTRPMQGDPVVVRCPTDTGNDHGGRGSLYHSLGRAPNEANPTWLFHGKAAQSLRDRSPILVDGVPAWRDNTEGKQRGATSMLVIDADGVRIVHCGDLGQAELTDSQVAQLGKVDVLILKANSAAPSIIQQVKPRLVMPIAYQTAGRALPEEAISAFLASLGNRYSIDRPIGNTYAVSSEKGYSPSSTRVVLPKHDPWNPTPELLRLFDRMAAACSASQEVFRPLSANQLSWRPPNGSHTPRWNAEHMMGRQLGFFSSIYAKLDPEIQPINLNPKQMPPDYQPAHPDWDGAEEARQMQRSQDFVRRFAYLLDGVDLDQKAPGSFWTPRRLLLQMERHFGEHTANVKKKFELEGWPEG